jgi:Spy/CpxP family protein refolding chaperone
MKNLILLTACILMTFAVSAQEDKTDRIESYKIAFLTERLNLTTKEAEAFWPVYNEYSTQVRKLKSKDKERSRAYLQKPSPSDHESEKFINDHVASKLQEYELMKKYMGEFGKVLPEAKVARLITLEQEFKMNLLKQLKDQKGPGR